MIACEEAAALAMLNYADMHPDAVRLANPEHHWTHVYAGNVEYLVTAQDGQVWKVDVFNDCDSWDYLDRVVAPDGSAWEYPTSDELSPMTMDLANWQPEHMHWYADEPHKAELWKKGPASTSVLNLAGKVLAAGLSKRVELSMLLEEAVRAGRKPV